jgi:hypothetical protein
VAAAIVEEVCTFGAGLAVIVNGLNRSGCCWRAAWAKSLRPPRRACALLSARYAFAEAIRATHLEILSLDKDATVRGGAALVHYETQRRRTTTP